MKRRAIFIGMDGASMDLVLLMVKEGHMPNLKGLIERGARAAALACTNGCAARDVAADDIQGLLEDWGVEVR
ncbi:hypothetical protein ACFLQU_04295 [Verrucomicrobiota bacterium]